MRIDVFCVDKTCFLGGTLAEHGTPGVQGKN